MATFGPPVIAFLSFLFLLFMPNPNTLQVTATPKNSLGNAIAGRTVSWASLAPAVASVSSTGLITAVTPGAAIIAASCGGVTSNVNITVQAALVPGITIDTGTISTLGVVGGTSQSFSVRATRQNGYTGVVNLSVPSAPAGVTFSFSNSSLTGSQFTSLVTMSVAGGTTLATYPITILATGSGVANASAVIQLNVVAAPSPSIDLSTSASALSVSRGATGTITASLTRNGGYTGAVTPGTTPALIQFVNIGGFSSPVQITVSYSNASLTGGTLSTVISLAVPSNFPVGSYGFYITCTGSGVTTAVSVPITITIT